MIYRVGSGFIRPYKFYAEIIDIELCQDITFADPREKGTKLIHGHRKVMERFAIDSTKNKFSC